jgi:phenylalanyl-tRNA synthetase alpha chain
MSDLTGYPELDTLLPRLQAVPGLDAEALAAEIVAVLGRKSGELTAALRSVPSKPVEERKSYGAAVNRLKSDFEQAFARRSEALEAERRQQEQAGVDLTMPARYRWVGAEHPVTRVIDEIIEIFRGLGFTVAVGPEVETDWYNFTALNFPADHPAMDMHDTLYVDAPSVPGEQGGRLLLRTHTSPSEWLFPGWSIGTIHSMRPTRPLFPRSRASRWTRGSRL